jgi:hypothetical protein
MLLWLEKETLHMSKQEDVTLMMYCKHGLRNQQQPLSCKALLLMV